MFSTLKRIITQQNYDSAKDLRAKLFTFYVAKPQMVNDAEYETLSNMLIEKENLAVK